MSSRERVLAALNHREPDRVPVDLSGHRSSGIAALLYPKLRALLGLPPEAVRVYDPIQQLAIVGPDVLERFGVDTLELGRAFALEDRHWREWPLPDGAPALMPAWAAPVRETGRWVLKSESGRVLGQMVDGSFYFEQTYWPLAEQPGLDPGLAMAECLWTAVGSPPGPLADGPEGLRALREGARALRRSSQRAILGLFGGNLVEMGQFLFGMDNFLYMLAAEPRAVHRFLDRVVEVHLSNLERFLGAVGESIDIIVFGDDLGMQTGPQFSPAMYREFFKPRHARLWARAKQLAPRVKVMLHCCGGVRELLPDLIDAGLEAINPVQTSCAGMEPAGLKRDFGSELVFWGGGCDTQTVLPQGTPEQVRAHVRARLRLLAPGGGFVFQQVHNILAFVPPENVVAMFEAVNPGAHRGAPDVSQ
jgi:uroporphyrinogen decarboxylase